MSNPLPVIVSFGGFNAAGRSSGHEAYERMIYESLSPNRKKLRVQSLAKLMGLEASDEAGVLAGTLVRRIEKSYFDVERTPLARRTLLKASEAQPSGFIMARKDLPQNVPDHWKILPLEDDKRFCKVEISGFQELLVNSEALMPVQSAGQLPSGFDPASLYRSQHHPRGLQLAVLGASDAVKSVGISWQEIMECISADQVAVYASSVMSQLDASGFGGMISARQQAERVTSKQLVMGFNTMPADFINAYVLGSAGATGGVTGACATFLYNLRYAVEEIKSGRRKVALVGASEAPILPEVIDGYAAMSALASDDDLRKLDTLSSAEMPDYRRASRPFGENCGFTLAESSQYVMLMADDFAVELGANILGAVPGVYVHADGFKRSISSPGAGNYLTLAKAVGLAKNLLGEEAVRRRSFVQAHGSSTPQNRVTESRIINEVARAFGISKWPVAAIKSYLGHSLSPASGDQLACSLGVFAQGVLPGIKTINDVAEDVYSERLQLSASDQALGAGNCDVAFLNSKGFGGNNASAAVFSPQVTQRFLQKRHGSQAMASYQEKLQTTNERTEKYLNEAEAGKLAPIYTFGHTQIAEDKIEITADSITLPGYCNTISLNHDEGFDGEF